MQNNFYRIYIVSYLSVSIIVRFSDITCKFCDAVHIVSSHALYFFIVLFILCRQNPFSMESDKISTFLVSIIDVYGRRGVKRNEMISKTLIPFKTSLDSYAMQSDETVGKLFSSLVKFLFELFRFIPIFVENLTLLCYYFLILRYYTYCILACILFFYYSLYFTSIKYISKRIR